MVYFNEYKNLVLTKHLNSNSVIEEFNEPIIEFIIYTLNQSYIVTYYLLCKNYFKLTSRLITPHHNAKHKKIYQ